MRVGSTTGCCGAIIFELVPSVVHLPHGSHLLMTSPPLWPIYRGKVQLIIWYRIISRLNGLCRYTAEEGEAVVVYVNLTAIGIFWLLPAECPKCCRETWPGWSWSSIARTSNQRTLAADLMVKGQNIIKSSASSQDKNKLFPIYFSSMRSLNGKTQYNGITKNYPTLAGVTLSLPSPPSHIRLQEPEFGGWQSSPGFSTYSII